MSEGFLIKTGGSTGSRKIVCGCEQAGTLSGNPLAMTAGLKTLEILDRPGQYEYLDKITKRLVAGILAAGRECGHAVEGGSISGRARPKSWSFDKLV